MSHYTFTQTFRSLYDKATASFASGLRGSDTYFTADENAWLAANGITAQHIYDYVEDAANYGEPDFATAVGIELIRRDYFLNAQQGKPSTVVADPATWPGKAETIDGIEWLPRIIPKARAKLRGELPKQTMYACGGDRKFFKAQDIHPTEFLTLLWRSGNDDQAIIAWVKARAQK